MKLLPADARRRWILIGLLAACVSALLYIARQQGRNAARP